jgi:hypothetical protein
MIIGAAVVFLLSATFLCWLIFAPLNEQIENQRRYRENIGRDYVRSRDRL